MVTYTTKHKAYGGYLWMPLPQSPSNMQDFALITMKQKSFVDDYFFDDPDNTMPLMDPMHFRRWMINLSARNGIDSFMRLTKLRCNGSYFGSKCVMFIVSIVSEMEIESIGRSEFLSNELESSIGTTELLSNPTNGNCQQRFMIMDHNKQDPHYMGTVVFRGSQFPQLCRLGMDEVSLLMESYPKSFDRYRTRNQGTFHMIRKRQSCMSNRSMGILSDRTEHDYFNDCNTNTSLIPMTSSLMNCLHQCSIKAQDSSGQVLIGLIKSAFKNHYHWKNITSDHVCPYGIMTCPQRIRKNEVIESFCNSGHRDSSDSIDDEQGGIVHAYVKTINSSLIKDYFDRMYAMFHPSIKRPRVPLPTTCAWKVIEKPEVYGSKHMSYFIVSEAGISWDLSSHVYDNVTEILGATFLSGLVEHSTSCSLWMEETTGWVTTLCPGNASNVAWGSSGKNIGLKNATMKRMS